MLKLIARLREGRSRRRRRDAAVAEAEVRRLLSEEGTVGVMFVIDRLRNQAHRDPQALQKANAMQAAIDRFAPRGVNHSPIATNHPPGRP